MKKTFVTLLAVAGLTASAQGSTAMTWDSAALDAGGGTLTIPAGTIEDVDYGLFSVTAVLDADAVVNAIRSSS